MSDETPLPVTPSQTAGPFLHVGLTTRPIARLAGTGAGAGGEGAAANVNADASAEGEPIQLVVRITDGADQLVTDALVEVWQPGLAATETTSQAPSEATSQTTSQTTTEAANESTTEEPATAGFGRLPTGADGACEFETVRPRTSPAGQATGTQATHINVCIFARGLLRQVYTRVYFAGDPALASDPVLALVPEDRRDTLLAQPDATRPGRWIFDVRLQGARETVFFDG
jgi:protocatechuate 3,4-dioxygenase alpha subunit